MSDDNKVSQRPPLDKATLELLGNPPEGQVGEAADRYNKEHAGGSVRIRYEKWLFTAPYSHVVDAVHYLRGMGRRERTKVIQSVNRSIAELFPMVKARTASQEQAMLCAQDVGLWYANEIIEGRATLEQTEEHRH